MTTEGGSTECFRSPLSAHWTPVPLRRALPRKLCDLLQPSQSSIPLERWLINDSAVSFRQIARYCNQSVASDRPVIKAAKKQTTCSRSSAERKEIIIALSLAGPTCADSLLPRLGSKSDRRLRRRARTADGLSVWPLHIRHQIVPILISIRFRAFLCSSFITHQEEWKKQRKWKNIIWQFS